MGVPQLLDVLIYIGKGEKLVSKCEESQSALLQSPRLALLKLCAACTGGNSNYSETQCSDRHCTDR